MNLCYAITFCLFLIIVKIASAAPITLHIDNTHSSIQFDIPFMAISEVTGRFERFCGTFVFDEVNMAGSRMELFIDASSINTGLKIRDRDLVEKYLEIKTYPIIYFKSKSVRLTKPKQFEVVGDLRLHGVSKELRITLNTIGDIINGDNAQRTGFQTSSAYAQPKRLWNHGRVNGQWFGRQYPDSLGHHPRTRCYTL